MGNFSLIRHNNFQTFIPETDIDGIDAKNNVLASISNFDYHNGYIETSGSFELTNLPSNVQTQITAGYELLSFIYFVHSKQGLTSFAVLWKSNAPDTAKLLFYVNNTAIHPDAQNNSVSYGARPANINYNLVNDQLKINLNTTGTYTYLTNIDSVILNLTLLYIDAIVDYVGNDQTVGTYFDVGWYLFPRWLGWNFNSDGIGIINSKTVGNVVEDFEDNSFIDNFSYTDLTLGTVDGLPTRCIYKEVSDLISGSWGSFKIGNIVNIGNVRFRLWNRGSSVIEPMDNPYSVDIYIEYNDKNGVRQREYFHKGMFSLDESVNGIITVPIGWRAPYGATLINLVFSIYCPKRFDSTALNSVVAIDDLTISPLDDVVIVGLFRDGQRGLLGSGSISIYGNAKLFVKLTNIDWRIDSYEIYGKLTDNGIYYLIDRLDVAAEWYLDTNRVLIDLSGLTEEEIDAGYSTRTLNTNYNLPFDTRVDNQYNILSEVAHKNRIYFVNGDYKVYQGHILPNLAIQADSFPYDEETGFGYFEVSHQQINKGLAVTPTNDLAIFTDNGVYIYYIESGASNVLKKLKMLTGSVGLVSLKSLAKSNSGDPKTDGLFWCDENGVYYYGGGINPPVNLLIGTHEKWWRGIPLDDKENSVGVYYPKLNEYWLVIKNTILVFEPAYKSFKTYAFADIFTDKGIEEFSFVSNSSLYCRSGNSIYLHTFGLRSAAKVVTHYNVGYDPESGGNIAEIDDKILQEVYMIFGDSELSTVTMAIYVDDRILGYRTFSTVNKFQKWLMDYGVRFNRIKFEVTCEPKRVRIKEFGCSFVPDFKEPLGNSI